MLLCLPKTLCKKASNHHANHTPGNVQFSIVTTWETPGNHWCWWPDTLIIARALARVIIKSVGSSAPVVSRCFPGGYNVKLYISRGMISMVVTGFFAQWEWWVSDGMKVCLSGQLQPVCIIVNIYARVLVFGEDWIAPACVPKPSKVMVPWIGKKISSLKLHTFTFNIQADFF